MSSLQRHIAPDIHHIPKIDIPEFKTDKWSNNLQLHYLKAGSNEVLRLEIFIRAGGYYSNNILTPGVLAKLCREGSDGYSAKVINEQLDYFGATLSLSASSDFIQLQLYCLSKHLKDLLPYIKDILCAPLLDEKSLSIIKEKEIGRLNISNQKNDFIARNTLDLHLYGPDNPFGYYPKVEDIEDIKLDDIRAYYKQIMFKYPWEIILSGQYKNSILNDLKDIFGDLSFEQNNYIRLNTTVFSKPDLNYIKKLEGSNQAAIAIGQLVPKRNDPNFPALAFLNILFGGFFGSRLMKNIREDKGFTYGIYSSLRSLPLNGQWSIYTEVGLDVYNKALDEIKKEIQRLKKEEVPSEEISLVKNYISGSFLASLDGPFSLADRFKSIHFSGMDYNYFNFYLDEVRAMNAQKILDIANQELFNSYHEVVIA